VAHGRLARSSRVPPQREAAGIAPETKLGESIVREAKVESNPFLERGAWIAAPVAA